MAITKLQSSRDFFRIWFFWKKQAIFLFFIIVGLVMLYAYTATPKYSSSAKILLLPRSTQDLVITAGAVEPRQFIKQVTQEDLNTEIDLIRSDQVIHATVRSFPENDLGLRTSKKGLLEKAIKNIKGGITKVLIFLKLKEGGMTPFEAEAELLKNSLTIKVLYESNILEVSLRGDGSKQVASVLDMLLKNYILYHKQVFSIDEGMQFYDGQAGTYAHQLRTAEQNMKDFQKSNNIVNLAEQIGANILLINELKKELQYIEIAYDENKTKIEILERTILQEGDNVLVTDEMRVIPAIIELEKSIVPLLIKRSEISKTFTSTSREFKDISGQIEMLQNEIRKETHRALMTDKLELESLRAKKDSLRRKVQQIFTQTKELKEQERTLQELQREVEFHKKNYLLYASKTEDSRIYSERKKHNLSNVAVVDPPSVSSKPVSPKKLLLLILSSIFGLIVALCFPFILESMDHKLKTADDVEILLGLPVVSNFPEMD